MNTSIFNYGELPEFKNFTPENIRKQFPIVLEKINEDFKSIEKNLSNHLIQNDLTWDNVINPLNEGFRLWNQRFAIRHVGFP